MHYGNIKNCDIADGIGVRVTLFVSGCTNKCPGCFQPETWDFNYGEEFTEETQEKILKFLSPGYIRGLTLLGGDPFEPANQRGLLDFVKRVKDAYPEKDIWAYSGFVYEDMLTAGKYPHTDVTEEFLSLIDVLVDGPFIEEKKNLKLKFCGSENQRLIDLNKTRASGKISIWNEDEI